MARIRIKLRLSVVPGKAGSIYYQVSHKKEVKQITTHIRLLPEEWDAESERVRQSVPSEGFRLSAVQRQLDQEVGQLCQLVHAFEVSGKEFRTQDIIGQYLASRSSLFVLAYAQGLIRRLTDKGKLGSARNLRCTLSSFTCFLACGAFAAGKGCLTLEVLEESGDFRNLSSLSFCWSSLQLPAYSNAVPSPLI